MKKILIPFLVAVSLLPVTAQEGLHLGFKAGPQFTGMFNKEDNDNPDFRLQAVTLRAAFGPTFSYHFSDGVGIGTELLFSYVGQKYKDRSDFEYIRKVTYLKLPILVHFNSDPDKTGMFKGYVGPQFAFPLKATEEIDFLGLPEADTEGFYKPTIGLALGLGAGINVTDYLQINIGIRLDGTFTDAIDQDKIIPVLDNPNPGPDQSMYDQYDVSGIFSVDRDKGERKTTFTAAALIEIGVKYILKFK